MCSLIVIMCKIITLWGCFGFWITPFMLHSTLLVTFVENSSYESNLMAPVILVPGVAGSRVEAKYHTHGHPKFCGAKSDWETIWISLKAALGGRPLSCWIYRYQLIYNRTAHRCHNQIGVQTRVKGEFGSLQPVDYLSRDPVSRLGSKYFEEITDELKDCGYSTDHNLKAASYDGRYAPIQQEEFGYFDNFTELVERVAADSKRKVAIVTHSMGGLVAAHFLRKKTQEWKDKHIHAFISISTPWLGSVKCLESYIVGTNYGVPTFKKSKMKQLIRTFQSVAYLLPSESAFSKTVLVDWTLRNKTYTANDYRQLFTDLKFEDGYRMREDLRSLFPIPIDKLGVKIHCIWSNLTEIKTLQKYEIADDLEDPKNVKTHYVHGDGTVTMESLRYCEKFKNVKVKIFQGYTHLNIIFKKDVIEYVKSLLVKAESFS